MASEGYVLLYRRFFDHPYWTEKRVYSRAEAWLDCWANMAAHTDHTKLVGSRQVELMRGEFLASDRFLMKRWGWSRGKVRRWIDGATEACEIRPTRDTSDGTIYLVVNFDSMQPRGTTDGTTNGTSTRPPSDQQRTKDNEGNKGNEVGPPKKRKSKLPAGWEPNDLHRQLAKREGVDCDREAANFRDHAAANGRRQLDWDASFRTWLRKASDYGSKPAGRNGTTGHAGGPFIPGIDG